MGELLNTIQCFFRQWVKQFGDGNVFTPVVILNEFTVVLYDCAGGKSDRRIILAQPVWNYQLKV